MLEKRIGGITIHTSAEDEKCCGELCRYLANDKCSLFPCWNQNLKQWLPKRLVQKNFNSQMVQRCYDCLIRPQSLLDGSEQL